MRQCRFVPGFCADFENGCNSTDLGLASQDNSYPEGVIDIRAGLGSLPEMRDFLV